MEDGECWACGHESSEVAHVLAKGDRATKLLKGRGLINFNPKSMANAVNLCPNCHDWYDDAQDPKFIFFPNDLDFFIRFELSDRTRRERERQQGIHTQRRVPLAREYANYQRDQGHISEASCGGQYSRLYLGQNPVEERTRSPKQWHGAPFATIRRAIAALGSPRIGRISPEVAEKLLVLRDLYYLDSDVEVEWKHGLERPGINDDYADRSDQEDEGSNEGEGSSEGEDDDDDFNDSFQATLCETKKRPRRMEGDTPSKRRKLSESRFEWDFGPNATSEDAMRRFGPVLLGPGWRI